MREIYTARLERKVLLAAAAQCYHFEFTCLDAAPVGTEPGQFFSLLAEDAAGKTYTRAYSIASAPRAQGFTLCLNRVEGGFFSNLLCDMEEGATVRYHGPHGLFTLRQPPSDGLLVAAGTGIAPMRSFLEWLFPEAAPDRSDGRTYWLVYAAPHPEELLYNDYFQALASRHAGFAYLSVIGGDGQLEQALARFPVSPAAIADERRDMPAANSVPAPEFERYAYVCGLSEMVKPIRSKLMDLGWQKRQILFERYD